MKRLYFLFLPLLLSLPLQAQDANPALPGFDAAGSDAKAIEIADKVMERLGGRDNWDQTRFVTFRFFGRRLHVWDKWSGDIRVEAGDLLVLMNLNSKKGKAWQAGEQVTHADSLQKRLDRAWRMWINDTYWVFMPYKLKDSGVTLKHLGEGTSPEGKKEHILELTFENVGVTPQNKYHVFVDTESNLVTAWSFYPKADDAEPRWRIPWNDWQQHGTIWLSDDRGRGKHSDLAVLESLPKSVFQDTTAFNLAAFQK